jgi:hypothetical protein
MMRHGLPAASTPAGMSRVTTLPAPITAPFPIDTPGRISALPPTQTSDPILTGFPNSRLRRCAAFSGCIGVRICTAGPKSVKSPMWTSQTSRATQLKFEGHPLAEPYIGAVVAEERRLHPDGVATGAEQFAQDGAPFFRLRFSRRIQRLTQIAGARPSVDQRGVHRIVKLAREHLVPFGFHVLANARLTSSMRRKSGIVMSVNRAIAARISFSGGERSTR